MPKLFTLEQKLESAEEVSRQQRMKLTLFEAQIRQLQRVNDTAESIRKEIYGLKEMVATPPTWLLERPAANMPGVPMTLWSDWHAGETVRRAQVGGVNEFNMKGLEQRVRRLVQILIDLTKRHMVRPRYPGIVCCLGGDMITGAIHDELAATNSVTVQQALLAVQELLIWALKILIKEFGRVYVPCVVGNHARDTVRPRFKNAVFQSYEWNLYQQLALYFRGNDAIQFHIPEETDAHFKVYGHRFTLTHGDNLGVKGGDGIIGAVGPIARGTTKVGRSEAQIGRDFDTLLMGHWHTYIPRGDAFPAVVNGSLIGYNEYARLKLRVPYSRPSQALWFVHAKHGFTASWPIYLDDFQQAKRSAEWVSWQQPRQK